MDVALDAAPGSGKMPAWLAEAGAGVVALAVYSATVAPGLTAGDSGELATAAAAWGLAHPPGYPLWTILAHGWLRLLGPFGFAPVQATNLLSALACAAAAALLARGLRRWTGSALASLAAALAFAASGPAWSAAVVTETYGLALLLLVAFCDATAAVPPRGAGRGRLVAAGLLGGWGLLAHQVFLLAWLAALPWLAAAVWAGGGAGGRARRAAWLAGGVALGALPLALLWWRAGASPDLRWGWQGPADLARYLTRSIYGRPAGAATAAALAARSWRLGWELLGGVGALGCALALAGWWRGARIRVRRWRAAAAAVLVALTLGLLPLLAPFTPDAAGAARAAPFLFVALPGLAAGWAAALADALAWARRRAGGGAPAAALACLTLAWPALAIWNGWPYHDRARDTAAALYAEDLLRGVPTGGALVVEGDNEAFPLLYLQRVEGRRPDVTVRHRRGCVFREGPDLYRLDPRAREAAVLAVETAWLRGWRERGGGPVCYATWVDLPPAAGASLAPWGIGYRLRFATSGAAGLDPLPWLGQRPAGEGARFLDHVTRRLLLAYPAAAARRARQDGDQPGQALAARALAAYAWDMPDVQARLAAAR